MKKIATTFLLCALNIECYSSQLTEHLDIHVPPVVLSLAVYAANAHGAMPLPTYWKAEDFGASVTSGETHVNVNFVHK